MSVTRFATLRCRNCLAAVTIFAICTPIAIADEIDAQRKLFQSVYATAELGNWREVDKLSVDDGQLLASYVLWPDLRAAWFRGTLRNAVHADIDSFLAQYGVLRPARDLRYRYALHLAEAGDLPGYLMIYQQFYQGLENPKLDCLALRAELAAADNQRIVNRAIDLWTVGKSQVEECDPVFAFLTDNKLLGHADFARRFDLSIAAHEFSLARWIATSIDQDHVDIADQWRNAQDKPEVFVRAHQRWSKDETSRKQLVYAIERITFSDPMLALELWLELTGAHAFSVEQDYRTRRHIALWAARDQLPGAYALLANLPQPAQSDEVLRWRARSSLREQDWENLLVDIALMSDGERNSEQWRYWSGVALQRSGAASAADAALIDLAAERSYYGFLAADEMGLVYVLDDGEITADESVISQLAGRPELIRARELYLVGLDGRGRAEWDDIVGYLTPEYKLQAAKLAARWGWNSRAIATTASVGEYDDLTLRYPLPFQKSFRQFTASANISLTWAYGVARSESLFMRDVRSSAGAIGLMQLMPTTGRKIARQLNLPYSGLDTLTNPHDNIRLGTTYLGQMANRYGGNQVLATAAYNAGPHRVDRWIPESGNVDARIWIENIPYDETRQYVKRVLVAETIFHWRITGQIRRLSDGLSLVESAADSQKVAENRK